MYLSFLRQYKLRLVIKKILLQHVQVHSNNRDDRDYSFIIEAALR